MALALEPSSSPRRLRKNGPMLLAALLLLSAFAAERIYHAYVFEPDGVTPHLDVGHRLLLALDRHPLIIGRAALKTLPIPTPTAPTHRVRIVRPREDELVGDTFHVDLLLVGKERPTTVEVWFGTTRVSRTPVPPRWWKSPGNATLTNIEARVASPVDAWGQIYATVLNGERVLAVSAPVRVWVARTGITAPASAAAIGAIRRALRDKLVHAIIALDRVGRDRPKWQTAARYSSARTALLQPLDPPAIREGVRLVFDAAETELARLPRLAGDFLNVRFERRRLPFFVNVLGSGRKTLVFAYELESPPLVFSLRGDVIRALKARRIDTLNRQYSLLGHQSTGLARAILLMKQIGRFRDELVECLRDPAVCVARHVRRNQSAVELLPMLNEAYRLVAAELKETLDAACEKAFQRCQERILAQLVLSVAHHEVRHVSDDRRGIPMAHALRTRLNHLLKGYQLRDETDLDARLQLENAAYNTVHLANLEMSAHLAELAAVPGLRRHALFRFFSFVTEGGVRASYQHAGRVILCRLGVIIGAADQTLCVAPTSDRRWQQVTMALLKLDTARIGRLAERLYRDEFGRYDAAQRLP